MASVIVFVIVFKNEGGRVVVRRGRFERFGRPERFDRLKRNERFDR